VLILLGSQLVYHIYIYIYEPKIIVYKMYGIAIILEVKNDYN